MKLLLQERKSTIKEFILQVENFIEWVASCFVVGVAFQPLRVKLAVRPVHSRAWFWNERFWLPENVSWVDLEHPPPGMEYPRVGQILYALPLAVGVFLLRLLFERLVAKPCAHILQIQAGVHRQAQPNAVLERVYQSKTCPDTRQLEGLSKQLDWDVRKIQRWFRIRRNQDKPSMQKKFCESMWRFTFYLGIFIYAIHHLWTPLSPGQYNHYVAELAFYWSLMFSQFIDVKRKDFIIMLVHHLATIILITFSYANNMIRMGTMVMCVHDASDIFLEVSKDDRSDIDSSSDEEINSSCSKKPSQTLKPKDGSHTGILNGDSHDH
eukprot:superscaffoldBa00002945_g15713